MQSGFVRAFFALALPLAVVASCVLFVGYAQGQQIIRQNANEPQVQLAESIAAELSAGAPPQAFAGGGVAPLEMTQSPFVLIYDKTGTLIAGTASVGGKAPTLPNGVLGDHKDNFGTSDNRITWQPAANIREALVITPYTNASSTGYVVVGRSLRETENEESALTARTLIGWLGTMLAVLIASAIGAWLLRKH